MTALTWSGGCPAGGRGELPQDQRRDRLRGVVLPADGERELGAHVPLDQLDAVIRVDRGGLNGLLPDDHGAVRLEVDHGRRDLAADGVGQDHDLAVIVDRGDHRVGGAEVDPDDRRLTSRPRSVRGLGRVDRPADQPGRPPSGPSPARPKPTASRISRAIVTVTVRKAMTWGGVLMSLLFAVSGTAASRGGD